jgi:nucleoside-diphosphate-sugar epimerase
LITGATGFVGSRLAQQLADAGWAVHAIIRATSDCLSLNRVGAMPHLHDGTIDRMMWIVQSARPDVVFHVASLVIAEHQPTDVARLLESNVSFGAQLLEAMHRSGEGLFINTGTYWQHFADADYSPVNLYAATKQAFVDLLRYYIDVAGIRAISLELFDAYGPNDPRPKLLSLLRDIAGSGRELSMTAGEQMIDLVHVDDVANAYLAAAERLMRGEVKGLETYSVSGGQRVGLRRLVEMFESALGKPLNIKWGAKPYRPREIMNPWTRGAPLPGWEPMIRLEDGLKAVAAERGGQKAE